MSSMQKPSRSVIVHYHIFKNAGSSLDEILKRMVPGGYLMVEGLEGKPLSAQGLADHISANPDVAIFSSHTAVMRPPPVEGITIFPVVFVRHPIDRIRSVYAFERRQPVNPFVIGTQKAKELDFPGYVRWRLDSPHSIAIVNHHVTLFARGLGKETSLGAALMFLEALPFVGVVERFDNSVAMLKSALAERFKLCDAPLLQVNVNPERLESMADRISQTREELGDELFDEVLAKNVEDLEFYRIVCARNGFACDQEFDNIERAAVCARAANSQ